MHFSVRTILAVTAAVAFYFGFYLVQYELFASDMVDWRRQLVNHCMQSLPLYLALAIWTAILIERRRSLRGAWYAIFGVVGFLAWEYFIRPTETWCLGDITDEGLDEIWWWPLRVVYYRVIVAVCWSLVHYAYFIANRPTATESIASS